MIEDIPTCSILGVNVAAINMQQMLDLTTENVKSWSGNYICVANVHTTVTASRKPEYLDAQNNAIITIPDGGPLSSVGRKRGYSSMARVTGPDYMTKMLSIHHPGEYRHVFYGSTPETIAKVADVLKTKYPHAVIVDLISPPFGKMSKVEDDEMVKRINDANADFVWVGLGAPKQELWMAAHRGRIKGVMVGVGAAFDYLAGNIARAPQWMQKMNLEWLYRLIQDPKRLLMRYISTNFTFIVKAYFGGE